MKLKLAQIATLIINSVQDIFGDLVVKNCGNVIYIILYVYNSYKCY